MKSRRQRRATERAHMHASQRATRERGPTPLYRTRAFAVTIVLAVAVGLALVGLGRADSAPAPLAAIPPSLVPAGNALGPAAAPVTVEVWSDFQCPFCRDFATGSERELIRTEVAQGRVRLVHRSFAFLGPESVLAAQAASCAADQNRFWEYHDKLFAVQGRENSGVYTADKLKRYATEIGLAPDFNACLDGGRHAAEVHAEHEAGQRAGVRATPTVLVNGRKLEGAASIAQLRALIDAR